MLESHAAWTGDPPDAGRSNASPPSGDASEGGSQGLGKIARSQFLHPSRWIYQTKESMGRDRANRYQGLIAECAENVHPS